MNRHHALGAPGDDSGDAHRAGAGAAGPGLTRAPLPHAHFYFARAEDLDELRVHPLGKKRVVLEARSKLFQIQRIDVVEIEHAVRVAHGNAGDLVGFAVDGERPVFDLTVGVHRNLPPLEDRLAHVDLDQFADDARPRDAVVVDIFGEAADAVAAHLHLAAVGVVDLHLEIGHLRGMDGQQLIGADTEAAIAKVLGDRVQMIDILFQAVEEDKIVARPVHLGEFEFHNFDCFEPGLRRTPLKYIQTYWSDAGITSPLIRSSKLSRWRTT